MIKHCQYCNKEIQHKKFKKSEQSKWWYSKRKYCSRVCMGKAFSEDRTGIERGSYNLVKQNN